MRITKKQKRGKTNEEFPII